MGVKITELGIEVPGRVVRKYDEGSDSTLLTLGKDQIEALWESLSLARRLVGEDRPLQPVAEFLTYDHRRIKDEPQA